MKKEFLNFYENGNLQRRFFYICNKNPIYFRYDGWPIDVTKKGLDEFYNINGKILQLQFFF